MKKPEILVVIPARGNSKSIPKKNIRDFAGHPLIAFCITAAIRSRHVTRVIVSTDNEEIAETAKAYGAEVPFIRPAELARDDTRDFPVFEHALEWLEQNEDYRPDYVIHLRATSPVIPLGLVDEAVDVMLAHADADSVRGVVPSGQNPYKMWHIADSGAMTSILKVQGLKEPFNAPRQSLRPTFWQTGHIDVIRRETLTDKQSMSGDLIYPVMIDPAYSIDIDTPLEWQRAERIVREGNLEMVFPGRSARPFPDIVSLVVFDFDGVFTDNRVWVDQDGREAVTASRSDGMGIEQLKKHTDIEVFVLSKETNPVVARRCGKLKIPVYQSVEKKKEALEKFLKEERIDSRQVIYVGNDINDIECFPLVGYAVVPADAHVSAKIAADHALTNKGGHGAVREICDMLINKFGK